MLIEANIADMKSRLEEYLDRVENGDEIIVRKHGSPVARITPLVPRPNRSKPGWAKGSIKVTGKITGPIPNDGWPTPTAP